MCLSESTVNHSITKNYKYKYATVFTNKLTTNQLQNIINRNIINGWQILTISEGYITMYREQDNYIYKGKNKLFVNIINELNIRRGLPA